MKQACKVSEKSRLARSTKFKGFKKMENNKEIENIEEFEKIIANEKGNNKEANKEFNKDKEKNISPRNVNLKEKEHPNKNQSISIHWRLNLKSFFSWLGQVFLSIFLERALYTRGINQEEYEKIRAENFYRVS